MVIKLFYFVYKFVFMLPVVEIQNTQNIWNFCGNRETEQGKLLASKGKGKLVNGKSKLVNGKGKLVHGKGKLVNCKGKLVKARGGLKSVLQFLIFDQSCWR